MPHPPGVPLSAQDRAILALESPTIAGHICKVVQLGPGAPSAAVLAAAVAARLPRAPILTRRLGGTPDAPAWVVDDEFDITAHVGAVPIEPRGPIEPRAPLDGTGLRRAVVALFEQRLDRSRPLWRMDLVGPLADGGHAVVWRVHHALADGMTAIRLAADVLWDPGPEPGPAPPAHPPAPDVARAHHWAGILGRDLLPGLHRSPLDARIGHQRDVAFATTRLPALHAAAHARGATVNDAVLAVTAGALRRWLEHRHGALHDLRVKVPVSLHDETVPLGNRDSYFCLALPVGEPDPVRRLDAVRAATALRKSCHDAQDVDELLDRLASAGPGLRRWVRRLQASPRTFALNVSNVPGPRADVAVLGAPVRALHSMAEVAPRHALRIAVVSIGDRLCFGLLADRAAIDDLPVLAAALEREAGDLADRAGGPPSTDRT